MMIWKRFLDYDYEVDNTGRVRRISTGRILSQCDDGHGYRKVTLWHNGSQEAVKVHRIVAIAFLGMPAEVSDEVNHIDSIRHNNCPSNLEWLSHTQNMQHAWASGSMKRGSESYLAVLDEKKVEQIKLAIIAGATNSELSKVYNVARGTIGKIRQLKTWKHVRPDLDSVIESPNRKVAKLLPSQIPEIRVMYEAGVSLAEIGRLYNVHSGTISSIINGYCWKNY